MASTITGSSPNDEDSRLGADSSQRECGHNMQGENPMSAPTRTASNDGNRDLGERSSQHQSRLKEAMGVLTIASSSNGIATSGADRILGETLSQLTSGFNVQGKEIVGKRQDDGSQLGSYDRNVAERMLKDYLNDLETTNVSASKPLMDYRARLTIALNDLKNANQLDPKTPLTVEERRMMKRMLQDYLRALEGQLQVDSSEAPDEPKEMKVVSNVWMKGQLEEVKIFVTNLNIDEGMDETARSPWRHPNEVGGGLNECCDLKVFVEMLTFALERCGTEVREISQCHSQVKVYKSQCIHLADTLSSIAMVKLHQFSDILKQIKTEHCTKMEVNTREDWLKGVAFCIQSLVELERTLHLVMGILSMCSNRQWLRTAVKMANIPPNPKIPRWSSFALALRKCEWTLDIVELSFQVLKTLITADDPHQFFDLKNVSFGWVEERRRLVLKINDLSSGKEDVKDELGALKVAQDLEMQDINTLLEQLKEHLASTWTWKRSEPYLLATFLIQKLGGPTPQANYLPYSCKIDHSLIKYKEFIDSGGFGMVALCTWLGEKVAVKNVNVSLADRHKFEMEAGILGKVQHPNVVQLIGCAFMDKKEIGTGTGMLVMEFMEHDLRTAIDKRRQDLGSNISPFPLIVAIDMMLQIAEAMMYLRAHGVLHRDLKAKNILVNRCKSHGRTLSEEYQSLIRSPHMAQLLGVEDYYIVKLADFGLAKCRVQTSFRTTMVGTTPYRAPEIFRAKDHEYSADYRWPADVYSFGMTCYEILTGHVPFDDVEQATIQERIISGQRPKLGGSAPPDLTLLIEACWDTNPDNRPDFSEISKRLWHCRLEITAQLLRSFNITRSSSMRRSSSTSNHLEEEMPAA